MKWWSVMLTASALANVLAAGCTPPPPALGPNSTRAADGLVITLQAPPDAFVRGQQIALQVIARNESRQPIRIEATSGAPVYLKLYHRSLIGWEQVRRYPEISTMVMSPWTLPPGESRTFPFTLTVEPDWPTNEPLRLTAELNGRPDAVASVTFTAVPPAPPAANP